MSEQSLAIVGWQEGNAGQIDSWIEDHTDYKVHCFINPSDTPLQIDTTSIKRDASQFDYPTADSFKGKPLINSSTWVDRIKELGINNVLITTDNNQERLEQIKQAKDAGLQLINAIHPSALIMKDALLEDNIIIHAKAVIGYRAELKSGVIVNTGAQVDHHCVLYECSVVDPGVVFPGNVVLGSCARVHSGATAVGRLWIGERSIVGAGAVVTKDVPADVTVVGVPAKVVKEHNKDI